MSRASTQTPGAIRVRAQAKGANVAERQRAHRRAITDGEIAVTSDRRWKLGYGPPRDPRSGYRDERSHLVRNASFETESVHANHGSKRDGDGDRREKNEPRHLAYQPSARMRCRAYSSQVSHTTTTSNAVSANIPRVKPWASR